MSDPSIKAQEAVQRQSDLDPIDLLHVAHDPALGLDRSVCLRDVVGWLRDNPLRGKRLRTGAEIADAIEREFGGGSSA